MASRLKDSVGSSGSASCAFEPNRRLPLRLRLKVMPPEVAVASSSPCAGTSAEAPAGASVDVDVDEDVAVEDGFGACEFSTFVYVDVECAAVSVICEALHGCLLRLLVKGWGQPEGCRSEVVTSL